MERQKTKFTDTVLSPQTLLLQERKSQLEQNIVMIMEHMSRVSKRNLAEWCQLSFSQLNSVESTESIEFVEYHFNL